MSASGFMYVFLAAALGISANLMMRAGIDAAGGFSPQSLMDLIRSLGRLLTTPIFLIGFSAFLIGNVAWIRAIASEPLSVAYPTLVGVAFVLLTAGVAVFLNEPVSIRKILGLLVILGGILLISMEKGT